jgi:hypothetical protein
MSSPAISSFELNHGADMRQIKGLWVFALALIIWASNAGAQMARPGFTTIPFTALGMDVPLSLTVPSDYVQVPEFGSMGIVVLCAKEDREHLKPNGDFSEARRAVITIRPSASDYYDERSKTFSFESPAAIERLKGIGASNYSLAKREIHGVPTAAMTFEVGNRKFYALALAGGPVLFRLSYNARSASRKTDDEIWASLVSGLSN